VLAARSVPQVVCETLSRVSSYDALGSFVLIPVGLSAVGAISALVGTRTTFFAAAALIVAATALVLLIRDVRTLKRR
jgi:hypothetical protein